MRKPNLLSAVLSLFLLVPASITWAQTISSQKGLVTAIFTTAQGNIKVYLPGDIRPGDVISGRIIAEPVGKNDRQVEKSLAELSKYSIGLNGEKFPVDKNKEVFQLSIPQNRNVQGSIELLNVSGVKVAELSIPQMREQMPTSQQCMIPSHAMTGSPLRIIGPFDGNSSDTKCSIDNTPATILAESQRQCIISYPADAPGVYTLNIQESNKQSCSQPVSGVTMDVSAGKLNLQKGERTYIDVKITGLQGLPDTAILTLVNMSAGVVTMLPLNNIIIPLAPDSVGSGTFAKTFDIQSLRTGSFIVNVNLDLPETSGNTGTQPNDQGSCACSSDCSIKTVETKSGEVIFKADVKAECKGAYGRGTTKVACSVVSITYKWHIGESGKDVAEINGKDDGSSVSVKIKGSGSYTLYLNGVVTCSDGSTCEFHCNTEETVHPPTTTECGLRYEWCKGPAIKVERSGFYPEDKEVLKNFRPGDLIGISAFAVDYDYLLQYCQCPEGLDKKKHPINPDEVYYDWELVTVRKGGGHGTLIKDPDPASNSVIYQLPYCFEDYPVLDKVILTIYNKSSKAKDEQVQIEFTISVTIRLPYYKEKVKKIYGFDIYLSKKVLNTPADVECKEEPGGDCIVQEWEWEKGSPFSYSSEITLKTSPDTPPDNLVLLHTSASDDDDLILKCFHRKNGKMIVENLRGVVDPADITWEVVKGNGSFPLGNKGAAVVFVHNYGPKNTDGSSDNEVTIRCTVGDSRMQFVDAATPLPSIEKKIKPRIQPAAFVGVGDIHYLAGTEHGELVKAGEQAVKNYEKAGYDVFTDFECKKAALERMYKNNALQAVLMVGHSDATGVALSGGLDFFTSIDILVWTRQKWGCFSNIKHPLARELVLLGCNVGEGEAGWYDKHFNLEKFYGRKEWVWSSAVYSSILKYVEKEHKPLPPRILDP